MVVVSRDCMRYLSLNSFGLIIPRNKDLEDGSFSAISRSLHGPSSKSCQRGSCRGCLVTARGTAPSVPAPPRIGEEKTWDEFSQAKCEEKQSQLQGIEIRLSMTEGRLSDAMKQIEGLENKQEYAENQSRRNNLKLIGVPESGEEKTWDDTECIVKDLVKEKLGIQEELQIKRCHRVNHKPGSTGHDQNKPRHIVAKFVHWKQNEMIVKKAREKKPDGIFFYNDCSANTLARRQAQIPLLDKMRKQGKVAYFIKDRLIEKDKPPEGSLQPPTSGLMKKMMRLRSIFHEPFLKVLSMKLLCSFFFFFSFLLSLYLRTLVVV